MQACGYRAPELCCGAQDYTAAIDVWAFGCFLAVLGGEAFSPETPPSASRKATGSAKRRDPTKHRRENLDALLAIFAHLGTPSGETLTQLPLFPQGLAPMEAQPWSSIAWKRLGSRGIQMLNAMLALDPALRPDVKALMEHDFFFPERLRLADLQVPSTPAIAKVPR